MTRVYVLYDNSNFIIESIYKYATNVCKGKYGPEGSMDLEIR